MPPEIVIRPAEPRDLPGIRDIYNHAIRTLPATFDTEEKTLEDREAWFAAHGPRYPVFVADDGGTVAGWSSLSPYHVRPAYRFTVENSVYVHPDYQGRGLGTRLLAAVMVAARDLGYHAVLAVLDGHNQPSERLHAKFGFSEVARLREVGWKFDQWHDVVILEAVVGGIADETGRLE
jgi:phosphinothricin acetyltransferase